MLVLHERVHDVLIADDDRAIRESLARALESEGYAITVVDGVEGLTHAPRGLRRARAQRHDSGRGRASRVPRAEFWYGRAG